MRLSSVVVVVVFLVMTAARAGAQPANTTQADAEFARGKYLMVANKVAEACAAFDESERLAHSVATVLNQGNCRELNGQLATAFERFSSAERETRGAAGGMAPFHQVARERASKLSLRVSKLTIEVSSSAQIPQLVVTRDGAVLDPKTWNQPQPIDGGTYTIAARAPGHFEWTRRITIKNEGDHQRVQIPKLDPQRIEAPPPPPPTVAAVTPPKPPAPVEKPAGADKSATTTPPAKVEPEPGVKDRAAAPASPARGKRSVITFGLGGAAIAFLGGAVGFELSGRKIYERSTNEEDDGRQEGLWQSANKRRYVAEGFAVAGVACAATAVWLYVRDRRRDPETSSRQANALTIEPFTTGTQAGVLVGRSW